MARLVPTATASTASALATSMSCLRLRRRPEDVPAWALFRGFLSRVGADMTAPLLCAADSSAAALTLRPVGHEAAACSVRFALGHVTVRPHRPAWGCSAERPGGGVDQPLQPQAPVDVQRR